MRTNWQQVKNKNARKHTKCRKWCIKNNNLCSSFCCGRNVLLGYQFSEKKNSFKFSGKFYISQCCFFNLSWAANFLTGILRSVLFCVKQKNSSNRTQIYIHIYAFLHAGDWKNTQILFGTKQWWKLWNIHLCVACLTLPRYFFSHETAAEKSFTERVLSTALCTPLNPKSSLLLLKAFHEWFSRYVKTLATNKQYALESNTSFVNYLHIQFSSFFLSITTKISL